MKPETPHAKAGAAFPAGIRQLSETERQESQPPVAALLRQWMSVDDGYDERIWPLLEGEFPDLRTLSRD